MEKIREWINNNPNGSGDGYGSGYGYGDGSGYGDGDGYGYGYGSGSCYSDGYGYGYGYGSGYGYGDGYGYGYGDGDGLKSINGQTIYLIDGVETLIDSVKLSLAKGYILNNDLTKTPCYVMKGHGYFAHGETPEKARAALQNKIFENLDPDEAIERFIETFKRGEKYLGSEFFKWHNYLTGSCEMGRNAFIRDRGLSVENYYTVDEFIKICKDSYGGDIIKRLKERYDNG